MNLAPPTDSIPPVTQGESRPTSVERGTYISLQSDVRFPNMLNRNHLLPPDVTYNSVTTDVDQFEALLMSCSQHAATEGASLVNRCETSDDSFNSFLDHLITYEHIVDSSQAAANGEGGSEEKDGSTESLAVANQDDVVNRLFNSSKNEGGSEEKDNSTCIDLEMKNLIRDLFNEPSGSAVSASNEPDVLSQVSVSCPGQLEEELDQIKEDVNTAVLGIERTDQDAKTKASNMAATSGDPSSKSTDERQPKASNDRSNGRWTADEHRLFLVAMDQYGRKWKKISKFLGTRTPVQVRTHEERGPCTISQ